MKDKDKQQIKTITDGKTAFARVLTGALEK